MNPSSLLIWAICIALAWVLFATITGADEWLRKLFGTSRTAALEERIRNLESRLEALEKRR